MVSRNLQGVIMPPDQLRGVEEVVASFGAFCARLEDKFDMHQRSGIFNGGTTRRNAVRDVFFQSFSWLFRFMSRIAALLESTIPNTTPLDFWLSNSDLACSESVYPSGPGDV